MARLINNPLGDISGKAGGLVFKKGKYGNYISSLPSSSSQKASALQQLQQSKMKRVMHFLKPVQAILPKTYFPLGQNTPTYHAIKSYYLKNALRPKQTDYVIDYAKCLLSYGDLRPPAQVTALRNGTQRITLGWNPQLGQALAQNDDPLFAVIYHEASHLFYFVAKVAVREKGTGSITLPQRWENLPSIHLWVGFARPEEKRASMSVYLGVI